MDTTLYEFDPLEARDPRTVGGYPLRARIGAGGMGRVYLSFTPGGRAVAVKLIRPEFAEDPEFRERFAREVAIAQRVNGIHIAQLIDAGTEGGAEDGGEAGGAGGGEGSAEGGTPWLASAYVPGPALGEVVAATGPVPPGTVLALAGRIAESLAAVHATGMVHRDLKPGNILLDETGPKVIDFGIVRAVTPTATGRSSHRTFIGSPPFMAPEQIRGQKITPATDVFALGATVYYLATGNSAFQADFADGVLYRVLHDEPDYEACPPQIRELIRACLRKDPAERPDTARIIEGCKAAGADRAPLLPEGVSELIDARKRALAVLSRGTGRAVARGAAAAPAVAQSAASQGAVSPPVPGQGPAQGPVPGPAPVSGPTPDPAPTPSLKPAIDPATDPAINAASNPGSAASPAPSPAPRFAMDDSVAARPAAETLPPPRTDSTPALSPAPAATSPAAKRTAPPGRLRLALAAVSGATVTAVVTVIAVLALHLSPSKNPSGPVGTGTGAGIKQSSQLGQIGQSSAVAQTSSATASSGTSSGTSGDAVRWQGQVLLSVNGVDLDSVPVNNASGSNASLYDSSADFEGPPYTLTAEPLQTTILAAWTGSGTPGRTQCLDQIESQGVNNLTVIDGNVVCVLSLDRHVASIKIVDTDANGGILADVVVWAQTAAPAGTSQGG